MPGLLRKTLEKWTMISPVFRAAYSASMELSLPLFDFGIHIDFPYAEFSHQAGTVDKR